MMRMTETDMRGREREKERRGRGKRWMLRLIGKKTTKPGRVNRNGLIAVLSPCGLEMLQKRIVFIPCRPIAM